MAFFRKKRQDKAAVGNAARENDARKDVKEGITVRAMFDFLKREGFVPEKDLNEESVIDFKYQGTPVRMEINDGEYIRLISGFSLKPEEMNYFNLLLAATNVMYELRMVKIVIGERWIQFTIETLVSSVEEYSVFFMSYLDILTNAITRHQEAYTKYEEERKSAEEHSEEAVIDKMFQEVVESQSNNPLKN